MLRSLIALTCGAACFPAFPQTVEIAPELWDRPRTGRAVLEQENIKRAVVLGLEKPDAQIVIHHAPGQEPLLQAEELKSWLAALAIDSRRIALRADGSSGAPMKLEIVP
jgi:hypothetical protein